MPKAPVKAIIEAGTAKPPKKPVTKAQRAQVEDLATQALPPEGAERLPGELNVERLGGAEEVQQLQRAGAEINRLENFDPVTWVEQEARAARINRDKLVDTLANRKEGDTLSAAEIKRARQIESAEAARVTAIRDDLLRREEAGEMISDAEWYAYDQDMNSWLGLSHAVADTKSDTARALNIMRETIDPDMEPVMELMYKEQLQVQTGGVDAIKERAKTVAAAAPKQQGKIARLLQRGKVLADTAVYYRNMMLLYGPKTHVRNIVGNSLANILSVPEMKAAELWSRSFGSGVMVPGEWRAMIRSDYQNARYIMDMTYEAAKTGESMFYGHKKIDEIGSAVDMHLSQQNPWTKAYNFGASMVAESVGLPGKALLAGDELFKGSAFLRKANQLAYRRAYNEGLRGKALWERVDELVSGPSIERDLKRMGDLADKETSMALYGQQLQEHNWYKEMYQESSDFAHYQTFTDEFNTRFAEGVLRLTDNPIMRFVVPFRQTPINLFSYATERSPLFALAPNFWADIKAGGAAADHAVGRAVMGSTISMGIFAAVMNGDITGSGPSDYRLKRVDEEAGWAPYTAYGVSYQGIEPYSTIMGVMADAADMYRNAKSIKQQEEIVMVVGAAMAESMKDRTFMLGLKDFLDSFEALKKGGTSSYMARSMSTFAPGYSLARAMTHGSDEKMRMSWVGEGLWEDSWNYLKNVYGMDDDVPPTPDFWGEDRTYRDWAGPDWLSPFYMIKYQEDSATLALAENRTAPSRPREKMAFEGIEVDLLDLPHPKGRGWAYRDYLQEIGRARKRSIEELIQTKAYQDLPMGAAVDEDAGDEITRGNELKRALSAGIKEGRELFMERYQDELMQLREATIAKPKRIIKPPKQVQRNIQQSGGITF